MKSTIESLKEIESKIYLIRGHKVMLDFDLAKLYQVTTFNLNKAVKRNLNRFPSDFMFRLTIQEFRDLTFQSGISSSPSHGGRHRPPNCFTQEGVAMLSSILRSEQAIEVNVAIMRAFVRLREMLITHDDLSRKIEELELRYDHQFQTVFDALKELMSNHTIPPKRVIGFRNPDR